MNKRKKLPIGIEHFEKLRKEDFYYVDKTGLIRELLENWGEVNLFTRPRRFGKSLNMNMLKYFFEYGCDASLFEGLKIAGETALCENYMGKFPVISVTLKDAGSRTYETAREKLCYTIGNEAMRFQFLKESDKLTEGEREAYRNLIKVGAPGGPSFEMTDGVLEGSLRTLSELLMKHYGQKVVLLIDEYDVPLDKAQHAGYYDEMASTLRGLLGSALKSNASLQFAVLTGCLRVAKESIFIGLNNLRVLGVTDVRFDEYFGFSDEEVRELLEYYGLQGKHAQVREWYDGYRFGNADVYCPWDVINYADLLRADPEALPVAFWINTSGNDVIRKFLRMAKGSVRGEIEKLVGGESVAKEVVEELTYRDLYQNIENVWGLLLATGYLTSRGRDGDGAYMLAIPNLEIRKIFNVQVMEWLQEEARKDMPKLDAFCDAVKNGDAQSVETQMNAYLRRTISIRDTGARKGSKEFFYHGFLLGLLKHREEWDIRSNVESGDGYSDILIETDEEDIGIVIEIKYADDGNLEAGCAKALEQIEKKSYTDLLLEDDMTTIIKYGIACGKKKCMVRAQQMEGL